MDERTILNAAIAGQSVHRRSFRKADGRMLHLYGLSSHDEAPLHQDSDALANGGELRFHPLRLEWNVYAAHRQNRTFKPATSDDPLSPTMPDGAATEIPFTNYEIAVFENKFSALHFEAPQPPILPGLQARPATGACEVIVYTPESQGNLYTIGQERRELLLATWIDRYQALFQAGAAHVMPFENRGDAVGVTLHHPHGQIYAFGHIPPVQQRAIEAFGQGYDLAQEIATAFPDYGVAEAGGVAAFCPRYARFPYECWIAPRTRRAGPWEMTAEERGGFAHLLGDITRRYDAMFGEDTPYMLGLHAAPCRWRGKLSFHSAILPVAARARTDQISRGGRTA